MMLRRLLALACLPTELTGHGGLCLGHSLLLLLLQNLLLISCALGGLTWRSSGSGGRRGRGDGGKLRLGVWRRAVYAGIRPRPVFFREHGHVVLGRKVGGTGYFLAGRRHADARVLGGVRRMRSGPVGKADRGSRSRAAGDEVGVLGGERAGALARHRGRFPGIHEATFVIYLGEPRARRGAD